MTKAASVVGDLAVQLIARLPRRGAMISGFVERRFGDLERRVEEAIELAGQKAGHATRKSFHYVECPKCESNFRVVKEVTSAPAHKCWAEEKEKAQAEPQIAPPRYIAPAGDEPDKFIVFSSGGPYAPGPEIKPAALGVAVAQYLRWDSSKAPKDIPVRGPACGFTYPLKAPASAMEQMEALKRTFRVELVHTIGADRRSIRLFDSGAGPLSDVPQGTLLVNVMLHDDRAPRADEYIWGELLQPVSASSMREAVREAVEEAMYTGVDLNNEPKPAPLGKRPARDLEGFLASFDGVAKHRARASLGWTVNWSGDIGPRHRMIEERVAKGWRVRGEWFESPEGVSFSQRVVTDLGMRYAQWLVAGVDPGARAVLRARTEVVPTGAQEARYLSSLTEPERQATAIKYGRGLGSDSTIRTWPDRKAMAKAIRKGEDSGRVEWRPLVALTPAEGY